MKLLRVLRIFLIAIALALIGSFSVTKASAYSITPEYVERLVSGYLKVNSTISNSKVRKFINSKFFDKKIYSMPYNYCKADSNGDGKNEVWVGVYPKGKPGTVMLKFGMLKNSPNFQYWGVDVIRNSLGIPENPPHPYLGVPKAGLKGVRLVIVRDLRDNDNPNDDKSIFKLEIQDAIFDFPVGDINKLPTCDRI